MSHPMLACFLVLYERMAMDSRLRKDSCSLRHVQIFQSLERKGHYSALRRLRRVARRPLGGHLLVPDMYVAAIDQTRLEECSPFCASVRWLEKELQRSKARLVVVTLDDEEAARLIGALQSSCSAGNGAVCVQSAANYFQAKYSANSKIVDAVEAILSSLQSLHQPDKASPYPPSAGQHNSVVLKGTLAVDKFKNDEAFVTILRSDANEDETYQRENSDDDDGGGGGEEEQGGIQADVQIAAVREVVQPVTLLLLVERGDRAPPSSSESRLL